MSILYSTIFSIIEEFNGRSLCVSMHWLFFKASSHVWISYILNGALIFYRSLATYHWTKIFSSLTCGIWLMIYLNILLYSLTISLGILMTSLNFLASGSLTSWVLNNFRKFFFILYFNLICFSMNFMNQVRALAHNVAPNYAICLSSSLVLVPS